MEDVNLPKTWRKPQPRKVRGLDQTKYAHAWVNFDNVDKYKDMGFIVLMKASSLAEGVNVGYDDSADAESRFTYRGQVLMVCRRVIADQMKAETERKANRHLTQNDAIDKEVTKAGESFDGAVKPIKGELTIRKPGRPKKVK